MQTEVLIYIYGAVCLSMIGFNIFYGLLMRRREPRLEKEREIITQKVSRQLSAIEAGEPVEEKHLHDLGKKLRHLNALIAFDDALKPLLQAAPEDVGQEYLLQIRPAMLELGVYYQKCDTVKSAYFCYVLSRYMTRRQMPIDSMQDILLGYLGKENLYCSVNVLKALCAFGSVEYLMKALTMQDRSKVFIHDKILTETLLCFSGDHDSLITCLWEAFDTFKPRTQHAILNYIRFRSGRYCEQMFSVMMDRSLEKELRLAAIRYFGKYEYDEALEPLLTFAADKEPSNWEYATVSISSLTLYHEEKVTRALKQALHSSNWYVRQAAAASLEAQGADYTSMRDIIVGTDRYAREMLTYRLETQRLEKAGDRA